MSTQVGISSVTRGALCTALGGLALCGVVACSDDKDDKSRGAGQHVGEGDGDAQQGDGDHSSSGDGDESRDQEPLGEPDACADIETTPTRSIPSVVFLVDGSGSMECAYPEPAGAECSCNHQRMGTAADACVLSDKSRWEGLAEALEGTSTDFGLFADLGQAIRFGLWIYNDNPDMPSSSCPGFPTRVDPALDQASALISAFPDRPPGWNTPTGLALGALVASLPAPSERDAMNLGPQRIVLATDGEPFACVDRDNVQLPAPLDYQSVLDATAAARAKEIDVYVMSLAPAAGDFASHLIQVAAAGNTTQAYLPADKAALSAALRAIIEDAIDCTVELEGAISEPDMCKGQAMLGGEKLRCGDANGFSIVDEKHVKLEGEACARFKREPGIALSMTFKCSQLHLL